MTVFFKAYDVMTERNMDGLFNVTNGTGNCIIEDVWNMNLFVHVLKKRSHVFWDLKKLAF